MATEDKTPKIGRKLLALRNDADVCRETMKRVDSSSVAIVSKVQEILVSCKELKPSGENDSGVGRPELCPKWIALLTMEKACLSTISLEGNAKNWPLLFSVLEASSYYYLYYYISLNYDGGFPIEFDKASLIFVYFGNTILIQSSQIDLQAMEARICCIFYELVKLNGGYL